MIMEFFRLLGMTWIEECETALKNIHERMTEILRLLNSEKSKAVVDAYLADVCRLREQLLRKVVEMQTWEQIGLFKVEEAALSRLNIVYGLFLKRKYTVWS